MVASELAAYDADERKVAQLVVSVAKEAAELLPQGAGTALILEVLKAKLGEKQFMKIARRFGWVKKRINKTLVKAWILRHCDDLKENESSLICTTKQRTRTDEEVLMGLVQLQLTIKPDWSVKALLKRVKGAAKNVFGEQDLKNHFSVWMRVNWPEYGFKVKWYTRGCLGSLFVLPHRKQFSGMCDAVLFCFLTYHCA